MTAVRPQPGPAESDAAEMDADNSTEHPHRTDEAPTRDYHPTPCAALLTHVAEVVRVAQTQSALRAYLLSACSAAVFAAGWLLFRADGIADRMAAGDKELREAGEKREVAIGVIQARLIALDASMGRLEGSMGKMEGKLDALMAQVHALSPRPAPP